MTSAGWCARSKQRMNMKILSSSVESASAGHKETEFASALSKLLGHYCSLRVFSAHETGLFWEKIPSSSLNSKVSRIM
jgi:hypothetical protein